MSQRQTAVLSLFWPEILCFICLWPNAMAGLRRGARMLAQKEERYGFFHHSHRHRYHDPNISPPRMLHLCGTCTAQSIISRTRRTLRPHVECCHFHNEKGAVRTVRPMAPLTTNAAAAAEEVLDSVVVSLYFPRRFRLSIFCQFF